MSERPQDQAGFGSLVCEEGDPRVNQKDQLCYKFRITEIDNDTVFHICCGNFKIEEAPSTPFEDEIVARKVVASPQDPERERTTALCESVTGAATNVNGGLQQEVAELCQKGIEVEDDKDTAPKNAQLSAPET